MDLKNLIAGVHQKGGTEIHLKIGSPPLVRQTKFLKRLQMPLVQAADIAGVIQEFLSAEDKKKFVQQRFFEANFFGSPPCNFRLNLFQAQSQTMAIVRIIRKAVPSFTEIGFPAVLESVAKANTGLFILAGPSRSGISTSLGAFVERINQVRPAHILIIEDPIEFYFEEKLCRISQRQFQKDLLSIDQGINFAKRMDVDILVIGDLKREVPFRALLDYVAGGHFVILSMQTLGVQNTLEKVIYSFPEKDRDHICNVLASSLLAVCSQALLVQPTDQKMVPIHEVLLVSNPIRGIIQKGRINQLEPNMKTATDGSQLFEQGMGRLVRDTLIPRETADGFLAMLRGMKA